MTTRTTLTIASIGVLAATTLGILATRPAPPVDKSSTRWIVVEAKEAGALVAFDREHARRAVCPEPLRDGGVQTYPCRTYRTLPGSRVVAEAPEAEWSKDPSTIGQCAPGLYVYPIEIEHADSARRVADECTASAAACAAFKSFSTVDTATKEARCQAARDAADGSWGDGGLPHDDFPNEVP